MPRIPMTTIASAEPALRPMLTEIQRRSLTPGRLLNIHAQMAHAPAVFAVYAGMRRALEEFSTLDFKTRSAIMLVTSVANDARYPIAIQIRLALRAGWTPAEVEDIRRDDFDSDPRLATLLRFVRQAATDTGRVGDEMWSAAKEAGWTSAQLAEAYANVAFATMVDAFARFAEPEFDVPEDRSGENAGSA
jgi:alkylhydroperoxidase/carboxymuconolactone decarboxylase family protein YurZ